MKKLFPVLCVVLLFTTSITAMANWPINISTSRFAGDERNVKNFNGVAAGGPINVVVTLGNKEGCRFEGDADAIATLIAEVKGNILIIRPQNSWKSWEKKYENKEITAYISAKTISSLTMSGSGSMSVKGSINIQKLTATLSGSGSIEATVNADNFNGVISGSGHLTIHGNVDDANIVISGSGSANIPADRKINAVISGSGNVNYSGDATVEKTVVGSGTVRKI